MSEGPDIARIAALIGEPARARMLEALMAGHALTASELAAEAGITRPTASSHIGLLRDGGLVVTAKQGRHSYVRLAGADVAEVLEALMEVVDRRGPTRARPGPRDPALRTARICYDHLAGSLGVQLHDRLIAAGHLSVELAPTPRGRELFVGLGLDLPALEAARRPLCRACLDWSERRTHLAGGLGAALLTTFEDRRWLIRVSGERRLRIPRGDPFAAWLATL